MAVLIMHLNRVFILKDILIYIRSVTTVFILKYIVHFCSSKTVHSCTFTFYKYATIKVKCFRYRPGVAQRVGIGIALLFHDRGTRRG